MTTKLLTKLSLTLLTLVTLGFTAPKTVLAAPRLYLDPTSITIQKDHEFSIALKIDAESSQVIGSDSTLNFAGDDQELIGVDNGGYFPEFTWAPSAVGKLEIHAYTTSIYQTKTGNGTVAVIKFKAKKDSGSSTATFGCTGSGNDTNIVSNSGQNILTCSNLNQASITYTGAPAVSPSPSPSPTPSSGPANVSPVCESLTLNPTSATGIPKSISFSCKGKDSDNQITGAEFIFGDGSTPLLVSNTIGSTGSINITHSYTKTGTMNVECRLRDTNSAFSNSCKQTLIIKSQPASSPTPKPKASPTPKGKVLALVDDSPTPTPTPRSFATPPPTEDVEDSKPSSKALLWIIPIIMGLGLIYLLYRYYKSTPPPIKY